MDGSIIYETRLDNKNFERDLKVSKQRILKAYDSINNANFKKNVALEQIKQAQVEMEKLKSSASWDGTKFINTDENIARITELSNKIATLQGQVKKYDDAISAGNAELKIAKEAAGALQRKFSMISLGKGIQATANNMVKSLKAMTVYAGKVAKSFLSMYFGGKKADNTILKSMKTMMLYSIGVEGLYSVFSKMRAAVSEGMTNLSQFSAKTNQSLAEMRGSLTQLKNSLATAFAPILTVVAPIIAKFVDMVSSAASAVARLVAILTGQSSYVRATKVQENYAKALGGTAAAAKEAQKSIMGFDELNTLNAENDGGGGGGTGTGSAFETVPIDPVEFDSWGAAFDAMLDSIINNGIPKLKNAFASFAVWLNGFTANLYEMFTFPGVDEKIAYIGSELARAFNGLVSQINWETLGGALGAGLDSALRFLVNFVWSFDWHGLGVSLATAFNNMISELDWESVGMWFAAKFKIVIDFLAGAIQGADMELLAQSASTLIISFLTSMTEVIASTDWQAIGNQIGTFLANIDWAGIVAIIAIGITELLIGLGEMIWGLVEDYFDDFIQWAEDSGLSWVDGIVVGIATGTAELLVAIWDLCVEVWEKFCEYFGIHSPSTLMESGGGFLIEGLLNGIVNAWGNLTSYLEGAMEKLKRFFSDTWESVKQTAADIWQNGIVATIRNTVNDIISVINGMISGAVSGVNTVARVMNSMNFTVPNWVPGFGGASVGFNFQMITDYPQIPYLAQGAVIPPNREFLAVLGDQRSGTNIEAPLDTIKQAVAEVMGSDRDLMREQNELLRQILAKTGNGITLRDLTNQISNEQRRMSRARGVIV